MITIIKTINIKLISMVLISTHREGRNLSETHVYEVLSIQHAAAANRAKNWNVPA